MDVAINHTSPFLSLLRDIKGGDNWRRGLEVCFSLCFLSPSPFSDAYIRHRSAEVLIVDRWCLTFIRFIICRVSVFACKALELVVSCPNDASHDLCSLGSPAQPLLQVMCDRCAYALAKRCPVEFHVAGL